MLTFLGKAGFRGAAFIDKTVFKNTTFMQEADFRGTRLNGADFEGASFADAGFEEAVFTKMASFKDSTVKGVANFESARFTDEASFDGASMDETATFKSAHFTQMAAFDGTKFKSFANFEKARFEGLAYFKRASFVEGATFADGKFHDEANFEYGSFAQQVSFDDTCFAKYVRFKHTTFHSATFYNSRFKSITSFESASFGFTPPLFDGATLHESTIWLGVSWPHSLKQSEQVKTCVRGYERLKLEMDRLKKHEDELNFFALELRARRVLIGKWSAQGLTTGLYGCLCDYGRSYTLPMFLLAAIIVCGAGLFLLYFGLLCWRHYLWLSAANSLGVLGLRREFFSASEITSLPLMLQLLSAAQTVLGSVLIFFFGLSLRNRFRMR